MDLPSGDEAGSATRPANALPSRRAGPPADGTTKSAPSRANAMRRPSGDHVGPSSSALASVSRRTPVPSACITYTWDTPSRLLTKATDRPSGDQAGSIAENKPPRLEGSPRPPVQPGSGPPPGATPE